MKTIILATGGTGGHIFPAQSIAQKLSEQGFTAIIFGDQNYIKYHPAESLYQFKIINSAQLVKSPFSLLKAGIKIACGILKSLFLLTKYQPQSVVAFGGYASFPTLVAALILRRKIILHEQNAHLGKVNRMFAKFADKIVLSYQQTDGIAENFKSKSIFFGNPVRQEILELSRNEYQLPNFNQEIKEPDNLGYDLLLASEFYNHNSQNNRPTFNILVLGGSGGARIFSEILPKAFFNLRDDIKNHLSITQQCRADYLQDTFKQYQSFNINIVINSFFVDIGEQIKKAHLVIARSGSSSLAEFTCTKKPMILVPFALAADNHQEKNARQIEKAGGAIVIKEVDFNINLITSTVEKLFDNPALLQKMSENSFKCAKLEAAENLVKLIISDNE